MAYFSNIQMPLCQVWMAPIQEQLNAFFKGDMPEIEKKDTLISIGKHIHNLLETKLEYEVDSLKEALWGFCAAGQDATAESLRTSYKQWKKERRVKEEAMAIKVEQAGTASGVMDVAPDQPSSSVKRSTADVDTDEPMAKRAKEGGEGEPAASVTKRTVDDDAEEERVGTAAEEGARKVAKVELEAARGFDRVMAGGQLAPGAAAAVAATLTTALAGSAARSPKMEAMPPSGAVAATALEGTPMVAASAASTTVATPASGVPTATSAPVTAIAEGPASSVASMSVSGAPLVSSSALARPSGASTSGSAPLQSTSGVAHEPLPAPAMADATAPPTSASAAFSALPLATSLSAASAGGTTTQSAPFMIAAAPTVQGNADAQGAPAPPGPAMAVAQAEIPSIPGADDPVNGGTPGLPLQGVTPIGTASGAGEAGSAGVGVVAKSASGPSSANGGAGPNAPVACEDSDVQGEVHVGASASSPPPVTNGALP
jgi:hypothetical protein